MATEIERSGVEYVAKGVSKFIKDIENVSKAMTRVTRSVQASSEGIEIAGFQFDRFTNRFRTATGQFVSFDNVMEAFRGTVDGVGNSIQPMLGTMEVMSATLSKVNLAIFGAVAVFKIFQKVVGVVTGVIKGFISGAVAVLNKALQVTKGVISALLSPLRSFGDSLGRVFEVASGFIVANTFGKITSGIRNMIGATKDAVSTFQTLTIQFENLVAREIRATMGLEDMEEAFRLAQKPALGLLEWIKQIAVTTPFEVDTLARTIAFSMAMGFASSEAQELTLAIGDFVAGMGLGNEEMERIILNFGQMRAAGKVTGTELRDLARGSLVPVNDIIKVMGENLGIAEEQFGEFKKAASEGKAPVDAFFQAFIQVAERDFPNAMERMSRTWQGVTSNIRDFIKTIIGVEVFGPVFDRITGNMADALDRLLSPAVRNAAKILGITLVVAFDRIEFTINDRLMPALANLGRALGLPVPNAFSLSKAIAFVTESIVIAIEAISSFVDGLAAKIAPQFDSLTEAAAQWGANFIGALAEGMAAAASAVVEVLIGIGNILADWLAPGSPPKIAPMLDKWGAQALTEYMQGWLMGDFDVFNEISGKIEDFLRSLTEDVIAEEDVIPRILGSRTAIANAIKQINELGRVTEGMLQDVFDAVGITTPAMQQYIKLMLDLEVANEKVAEAQEALNEVTEKYDKILDPLEARLDRIRGQADISDNLRRIAFLEKVLEDVNATAAEKERARLEIEALKTENQITGIEDERDAAVAAAEDKLQQAEAEAEAIRERMEIQRELLDVQIDQNKLIKEQVSLLEKLSKAGGAALENLADALSGLGAGGLPGAPEFEIDTEALTQRIRTIFGNMRREIEAAIQTFTDAFEERDFVSRIEELEDTWGGIFGKDGSLSTKWNELFGEDGSVTNAIAFISPRLSALWESILTGVQDVNMELDELIMTFEVDLPGSMGQINALGTIFTTTMGIISAVIGGILGGLSAWIDAFSDVTASFQEMADGINMITEGDLVGGFLKLLTGLRNSMWNILKGGFQTALGFVDGFIRGFIDFFVNLKNELVGESIIPEMMDDMFSIVSTKLNDILVNIGQWIADTIAKFEQWAMDLVGEGGTIPTMIDDFLNLFTSEGAVANFIEAGASVINGLWEGMKNTIGPVLTWLEDQYQKALDLWDKITDFGSPSKKFIERGESIPQSLQIGIEKASAGLFESMTGMANQLVSMSPGGGMASLQGSMQRQVDTSVQAPMAMGSGADQRHFHLHMNTTRGEGQIMRDFAIMETLFG